MALDPLNEFRKRHLTYWQSRVAGLLVNELPGLTRALEMALPRPELRQSALGLLEAALDEERGWREEETWLDLLEKNEPQWSDGLEPGRVSWMLMRARLSEKMGGLKEAARLYSEVIEAGAILADAGLEGRGWLGCASLHWRHQEWRTAGAVASRAKERLGGDTANLRLQVQAELWIGASALTVGGLAPAETAFWRARELSLKLGDDRSLAVAINNLAWLAAIQSDWRAAFLQWGQVAKRFREIGRTPEYLGVECSRALFHIRMGKSRSALRALERAEAAARTMNPQEGEAGGWLAAIRMLRTAAKHRQTEGTKGLGLMWAAGSRGNMLGWFSVEAGKKPKAGERSWKSLDE